MSVKDKIDLAILQFEKDFGFTFYELLSKPDKYQEVIKQMESGHKEKIEPIYEFLQTEILGRDL